MIFSLFRVHQWYKNLVIFLPLIFVGLGFNLESIFLVLIGFFVLCFMSSANYIINDILDFKRDKLHPEKKNRALVSKKISFFTAGILAFIFASISLTIAIIFSLTFFYILLLFFFLTFLYSAFFKQETILDFILIATNFVLRAVSGAVILNVRISPWLIICTFFLSMFLILGKRYGDLSLLKQMAVKYNPVLKKYSGSLLQALLNITTAILILSYCLYTFLSIYPALIFTIPIAVYVILYYYYLIETENVIVRRPELFVTDLRLLLGILLWFGSILFVIYI